MKKVVISVLAAMCFANLTFAEDKAPKAAETKKDETIVHTKEQRAEMATRHEKMAECLRSDKPMSDCHKQMQAGCKEGGCPMMGQKMGHKGCPMMDHKMGHKGCPMTEEQVK